LKMEVKDAGDGIPLVIPIADGVALVLWVRSIPSMTDAEADELIRIVRNKLNARL